MPVIYHELIIGVPAEDVYRAITTQEGLSAWWTPGAIAKPEIRSTARFPFGPEYFKEMEILQLKPCTYVQWSCIAGAVEWIDTTISFTLQSENRRTLLSAHPEIQGQLEQQHNFENGTLLIFHHDNWETLSPMFAECNYTWGQFLRSLKLFCETGKGRPWPHQHLTES